MSRNPPIPVFIFEKFGLRLPADQIQGFGNAGGFSGANIWRADSPLGPVCLRRWPSQHPSISRLDSIHQAMKSIRSAGVRQVPRIHAATRLETAGSQTIIEFDGRLWELTDWMPGSASFHDDPNEKKVESAMRCLATFHLAASRIPDSAEFGPAVASSKSPGLGDRSTLLQTTIASNPGRSLAAAKTSTPIERQVQQFAAIWFDHFRRLSSEVALELKTASQLSLPTQLCLRDIWHDHLLFEEDSVTGIVDYGAMRMESVAGDLARLLASLFGDQQEQWQRALKIYESIRPLNECERAAMRAFDRSAILLSPFNWFRWVLLEKRSFEQPERLIARIDNQLARLRNSL